VTDREVQVHVDLHGRPCLAGRLFMRVLRGRESASFTYDDGWLRHPERFALDPIHLPLTRGAFNTAGGQALFAGLSDSAPDRWGRMLMSRQARLDGLDRTLFESDFLLMVHDPARQGALRFRSDPNGPFLASGGPPLPPLVRLGELLAASDRLHESESDADALRLLLAPGSSLGGARPKSSVLEADGTLAIAKFPAPTDDWPVTVWEKVVCEAAGNAGLRVQSNRLVSVAERRVLVSRRFDRAGAHRVPFLSGMAMVGATDRDSEASYLDLVEAIRQHGARVDEDLEELWKRMAFNVLISCTDDHLRNHGFLREVSGWVLSPAYDLNPVPVDVKPRVHALALDDRSYEASIRTVLDVAGYFGLEQARARRLARRIANATSDFRRVARAHGLSPAQIDRMRSAFEHDDLEAALRLPG
jgi:serine/threonine-protein kinase HipA